MILAALRDLQWRMRRYLIAAIGTALVFAMTMVLTGLSNGFTVEAEETMALFDADAWIVQTGAAGPFLGAAPFEEALVAPIGDQPGVEVGGIVFGLTSTGDRGSFEDINVFGAEANAPGMPEATEGRAPAQAGEIMISTLRSEDIGDRFEISGQTFEVVGRVRDASAIAGVPNVYLTLPDAQEVVVSGAPIVSSVAVRGSTPEVEPAFEVLDGDAALDDLLRPLEEPRESITFVAALLWIVAALIIGSVVYLSALERARDFAVFKAVGVSTRGILIGVAGQAVVLALVAAVIGIGVGQLLAPVFPMKVVIPTSAFVALPVLAVVVGVLASTVGMRRVATVDPAAAFGGP